MKNNYETPNIEVIEIEIENAILNGSGNSIVQENYSPMINDYSNDTAW